MIAEWESFLTDKIEGFFNDKLAGDIEPAELFRAVEKEIAKQKRAAKEDGVLPGAYFVFLGENDYNRLSAGRIIDMAQLSAQKEIIRSDGFARELKVMLRKDPSMKSGLRIEARTAEEEKKDNHTSDGEDAPEETIVLERLKYKNPLNLPACHTIAALSVKEGVDEGSYLDFGEKKIYIGRRDRSDFIVTDDSVSRLHASVEYDMCRHLLRDEESANGTFVNGNRIDKIYLKDNDEIKIGNTVLRYEVL